MHTLKNLLLIAYFFPVIAGNDGEPMFHCEKNLAASFNHPLRALLLVDGSQEAVDVAEAHQLDSITQEKAISDTVAENATKDFVAVLSADQHDPKPKETGQMDSKGEQLQCCIASDMVCLKEQTFQLPHGCEEALDASSTKVKDHGFESAVSGDVVVHVSKEVGSKTSNKNRSFTANENPLSSDVTESVRNKGNRIDFSCGAIEILSYVPADTIFGLVTIPEE